jgi:hypothetical protein
MFGVYMRLFCVCAVLCLEEALRRADHSSKESYRLWIDQETEKEASAYKGCKAIKKAFFRQRIGSVAEKLQTSTLQGDLRRDDRVMMTCN